eukprot:gnl/TRDRNA2_/TRDRNA2_151745_c1_seq1.p1 gnl/TRDRNA2_/TRDRNA2_151745_c1~~gnl/TRDRNA2_/TRDRNA2_151745_c1_seq1.p1  ORF type:complete len:698 (+),score=87.11 gnl/TRDRNA2_/TRDRNA2_151745_c1_seq1:300-2096(+)
MVFIGYIFTFSLHVAHSFGHAPPFEAKSATREGGGFFALGPTDGDDAQAPCDVGIMAVPFSEQRSVGSRSVANSGLGSQTITLLTYNLGLLRLRCCCREVFSNPPYADDRFPHHAAALLKSGADVISLQEIYENRHVKQLLQDVKATYPYHARGDTHSNSCEFHNGLMFISKHPIVACGAIRHAQSCGVEKYLASKALLWAWIETPAGNFCMVNMHTTAGGGVHPEKADSIRESELGEVLQACKRGASQGYSGIVIGDLNAGPEASADNYQFMLRTFVDAVEEAGACKPTWDPANPLNAVGPHASCPPQRCDHILVHKRSGLIGVSAEQVFTEACVQTAGGMMTMSDHYGIKIVLKRGQRSQDVDDSDVWSASGASQELCERQATRSELRLHGIRFALGIMGRSVLGSAATTIGCSLFLLLCTMGFFVQFGLVILIVTVLSLVYSLLFLPALLALAGPVGPSWCMRIIRRWWLKFRVQFLGHVPEDPERKTSVRDRRKTPAPAKDSGNRLKSPRPQVPASPQTPQTSPEPQEPPSLIHPSCMGGQDVDSSTPSPRRYEDDDGCVRNLQTPFTATTADTGGPQPETHANESNFGSEESV